MKLWEQPISSKCLLSNFKRAKENKRSRYSKWNSKYSQKQQRNHYIKSHLLAATLKDIGNTLNVLGAGPASGLQREYSIAKSNYFYSKTGEDIEEWLAKMDWMLAANNVIDRRRVAVAAAHLRDVAADWYEANKVNINWYIDNNAGSFIKWIKARFTLDAQKD